MSASVPSTQKTAPVDSAFNDAYSRVRTSQPYGIFAVQCQYNLETFLMEGGATGTGTAPAHANGTVTLVVLGCGGASNCRAVINYYEVR